VKGVGIDSDFCLVGFDQHCFNSWRVRRKRWCYEKLQFGT